MTSNSTSTHAAIIQNTIDALMPQIKNRIEAALDAAIEETYQRLSPPMGIVVNKSAFSPESIAELEQVIARWENPRCSVARSPDYEAMWNALRDYPCVRWEDIYVTYEDEGDLSVSEIIEEIELRYAPKKQGAPSVLNEDDLL